MKDMGIVQGSYESSRPIVIGKTTVYVHDNIHEVEVKDEDTENTYTIWQYHEVQYDKDEYISLMDIKESQNTANIDYLAMMSDIDLPESEE